MGYTTDFNGGFGITPTLSPAMRKFLMKFNEVRHMKRRLPERQHGVEGEFFVDGGGDYGQDQDATIIDYNVPPRTQPELWCQWRPNDDGTAIEWDGGEKFYEYEAWLRYLIDKVLAPNKYVLNGAVLWQGEDIEDRGKLIVKNNKVTVKNLE